MTRALYLSLYALFSCMWLVSCGCKTDSSGNGLSGIVLEDERRRYDALKFDYQFSLLNQYRLENSILFVYLPVYNNKGQETTLEEELKGTGSSVLFIRIYGDCFTCIAELIHEQINLIGSFDSLLNRFEKVILVANVDSPRELVSVIDMNRYGNNFHTYYVPDGANVTEKENGRRGIYYSTLGIGDVIRLNHVYFPVLGETAFQKNILKQF